MIDDHLRLWHELNSRAPRRTPLLAAEAEAKSVFFACAPGPSSALSRRNRPAPGRAAQNRMVPGPAAAPAAAGNRASARGTGPAPRDAEKEPMTAVLASWPARLLGSSSEAVMPMPVTVRETELPGVLELEVAIARDDRGFFTELYSEVEFKSRSEARVSSGQRVICQLAERCAECITSSSPTEWASWFGRFGGDLRCGRRPQAGFADVRKVGRARAQREQRSSVVGARRLCSRLPCARRGDPRSLQVHRSAYAAGRAVGELSGPLDRHPLADRPTRISPKDRMRPRSLRPNTTSFTAGEVSIAVPRAELSCGFSVAKPVITFRPREGRGT